MFEYIIIYRDATGRIFAKPMCKMDDCAKVMVGQRYTGRSWGQL